MSGYKLVIGFIGFVFAALLWIPLDYTIQLIGTALIIPAGGEELANNINFGISLYYVSLFILLIATTIWIIKPEEPNATSADY